MPRRKPNERRRHTAEQSAKRIAPRRSGSSPLGFRGFRRAAASEAIAAGESAGEASWKLDHRNSVVPRATYFQEIKSAERTAPVAKRLKERSGDLLDDSMPTVQSRQADVSA